MLERRVFTGGADTDTEIRLMKNGDYRYALNCRIGSSDGDSIGAVTNVLGNTLVEYTLPGGANKTVGTKEDKTSNSVIYMVWNENANHSILQYFPKDNTIVKIMQSALLNFQKDNLITGINLIDSQYLAWTDDFNEPSLIDIVKAKANLYPTLKRQYLDRIPYPYLFSPAVAYDTDNTRIVNNVRGKLFQFKIKYVYFDNRESAWSPISKIAMPPGEIYNATDIPNYNNNVINVGFDTGDEIVTKIKIAVREGNLSDFFLVQTIDKKEFALNDNASFTFKFYNDGIYTGIDLTDSISLFDHIPLKSKSQELIDGNRIADGDALNGFDQIPVSVRITPIYNTRVATNVGSSDFTNAAPTPGKRHVTVGANFTNASFVLSFKIKSVVISVPGFPSLSQTISPEIIKSYSFQASSVTTKQQIKDFFINKINTDTDLSGKLIAADLNADTFEVNPVGPLIGMVSIYDYFTTVVTGTVPTLRSFKAGALHKFGVVYYEKANRSSTIMRSKECEVFVKFFGADRFNQVSPTAFTPGFSGTADLKIQIFHTPPVWATHYQILYTKNQTVESFVQFTVNTVVNAGNKTTMSLENITDYSTENPNSIISYGFAKGDRLRVFYVKTFTNTPAFPSTPIDVEVLDYDEGTQTLTVPLLGETPNLVEIYKPKKNVEDVLYREIGEVYTIGNAGTASRFHSGNTQNQGGVAASVVSPGIWQVSPGVVRVETPIQTINSSLLYVGDYVQLNGNLYNGLFKVTNIAISGTIIGAFDIETTFKGNEANVPVIILTPAILTLTNEGDVYYKRRVMEDELPLFTGHSYTVEDYNFSDFYVSNYWNMGRPNRYDPNAKQQRRPATVYYSQPYITDTNINGLGTVYEFNFNEYDKNYGSIQRMYAEDRAVIVFQQLKVGRLLVNQFNINDAQGNQVIGASESVLSDIIYYKGEYGIGLNPESFAVYGQRKYFTDVQRGAVLRLSGDGISEVSEYQMYNYFTDTFREILQSKQRIDVIGVYDVKFGEYVVSLSVRGTPIPITVILFNGRWIIKVDLSVGVTDTIDVEYMKNGVLAFATLTVVSSFQSGNNERTYSCIPSESFVPDDIKIRVFVRETVAFGERINRWTSFYSFQPENMVGSNVDILSFKDGKLYVHNSNSVHNNFYGVQYHSEIHFPSNAEPTAMKVYDALEVQSNTAWRMIMENDMGQKTNLLESDFENIEGMFWAAFMKDENTPVLNPLFEGDDMRCHSGILKLTNSDTTPVKLFSAGVRINSSELTNR